MATTNNSFSDLQVSKVNFDDLIMQLEKFLRKSFDDKVFLAKIFNLLLFPESFWHCMNPVHFEIFRQKVVVILPFNERNSPE